jgi:hypothetical protein
MDKGAARSRKRQEKITSVDLPAKKLAGLSPKGTSLASSSSHPPGQTPASKAFQAKHRPQAREPQSRDPSLYKAKAVRTSAALVYSEAAFPLPPPKDLLKGVRRVDLAGSGVTDVGWLKECEDVTWLNLAGCEGLKGWEGVGELKNLSG